MTAFPQELRDLATAVALSDITVHTANVSHMNTGTPETLIAYRIALTEWCDLDKRFRQALSAYMASQRAAQVAA